MAFLLPFLLLYFSSCCALLKIIRTLYWGISSDNLIAAKINKKILNFQTKRYSGLSLIRTLRGNLNLFELWKVRIRRSRSFVKYFGNRNRYYRPELGVRGGCTKRQICTAYFTSLFFSKISIDG